MGTKELNAVAIEVLWTRIISAVDEAAKVIVRTSFSTLSNEANDFACVLTDECGNSLAQNTGSIPSFIGTLPATVKHFLAKFGAEKMQPGDVFVTNDPWKGTGHLNDISLVKPIFRNGVLVAFAATTSHVPDIGGRIRSIEPREVFEEGFHIPLMRFISAGKPDDTLIELLRENVRTPDQTTGDVWAQVGAIDLIEKRILGMMREHDLTDLRGLAAELFSRSERAMREAIEALPDGIYRYEITTDGVESPLSFKLALTIEGGELELDYAGTSPQQPRAINCVYAYTFAMSIYALKCSLLPNLPNNEGILRAVKVRAPEGSVLNPVFPVAVGARAATGHYVPVLVFGALHQIIPDRVMAAPGSPLWILTLSGVRTDGKPYANVLFFNGGTGGRASGDGVSCLSWPSNISSTPVEVSEHNDPLFIHYKRLRANSGGAGEFRGGLGQDILLESTSATDIQAVFMTERTRIPAPGLGGGNPGGLGEVWINDKLVNNRVQHILKTGDRILMRTPGGGGYNSSATRTKAQNEIDRELGYVE
ncbi:hydantoinase [Bradyrhizobium sp. LTSP885]|uniref:hydantoinase B/oxoprolinase family protein n=1 Tax=Bradyrhizobium sp. LTSP885 TaxID=1619232 RepID=UPI0005C95270|nr:hydantoinase B/oxoprolinase family protein [Bradyrhizobium sp. LTSP885]KJC50448.1 hydantoinase [Bradyrhizobium sp. LTSP885]